MSSENARGAYESPKVAVIGALHEVTQLTHKYFATSTDYIYPNGYKFNVS
jgi:hypothetical protein